MQQLESHQLYAGIDWTVGPIARKSPTGLSLLVAVLTTRHRRTSPTQHMKRDSAPLAAIAQTNSKSPIIAPHRILVSPETQRRRDRTCIQPPRAIYLFLTQPSENGPHQKPQRQQPDSIHSHLSTPEWVSVSSTCERRVRTSANRRLYVSTPRCMNNKPDAAREVIGSPRSNDASNLTSGYI